MDAYLSESAPADDARGEFQWGRGGKQKSCTLPAARGCEGMARAKEEQLVSGMDDKY